MRNVAIPPLSTVYTDQKKWKTCVSVGFYGYSLEQEHYFCACDYDEQRRIEGLSGWNAPAALTELQSMTVCLYYIIK